MAEVAAMGARRGSPPPVAADYQVSLHFSYPRRRRTRASPPPSLNARVDFWMGHNSSCSTRGRRCEMLTSLLRAE